MRLGTGFGYTPIVAMAAIGRSEVLVLRGDPHAALGLVDWGLKLTRHSVIRSRKGTALRVRGTARAATDELAEQRARGDFQQALALARSTDNVLLEAETLRDLAHIAAVIPDAESARQHYRGGARARSIGWAPAHAVAHEGRVGALGGRSPGRLSLSGGVASAVPLRFTPHAHCSVTLQPNR